MLVHAAKPMHELHNEANCCFGTMPSARAMQIVGASASDSIGVASPMAHIGRFCRCS